MPVHPSVRLALVLTAAPFVGCGPTADYDLDDDGVVNFDDCAPEDPTSYPGAKEICDGVDNNCDTRIDDGITATWYTDADGDGHGDPASAHDTCAPDPTDVTTNDDCDDTNAASYPGALELCDGEDNDCNEVIDDERLFLDFNDPLDRDIVRTSGSARIVQDGTNNILQLTRAASDLVGGLWLQAGVPSDRWRVTFRFRMVSVGDTDGEGMAFAFLNGETSSTNGDPGRDMGLYGANADGVGIEWDIYRNDGDDTTALVGRHMALHDVRSGERLAEQTTTPNFTDGAWRDAIIEYDEGLLTVSTGPTVAFDHVDLALTLDPLVTLGVSAATSTRTMQISIDDFKVTCPLPDVE
ncbi:MAG: hypothetical protein H6733_12765 [Alphaproteobacteria bacterium]|nr:hypothetical protein [Alphaproteobacteria bacterium]